MVLFAKLIDTQAPVLIVRVLLFWYQMQNVCMKWGNSYSHYFTICNGVRQGGILSPRLFAIYVNQLTDRLLSCNAGCYINDMCINHVMYSDDICLLAPSASAMYYRYVLFLNLRHVSPACVYWFRCLKIRS